MSFLSKLFFWRKKPAPKPQVSPMSSSWSHVRQSSYVSAPRPYTKSLPVPDDDFPIYSDAMLQTASVMGLSSSFQDFAVVRPDVVVSGGDGDFGGGGASGTWEDTSPAPAPAPGCGTLSDEDDPDPLQSAS